MFSLPSSSPLLERLLFTLLDAAPPRSESSLTRAHGGMPLRSGSADHLLTPLLDQRLPGRLPPPLDQPPGGRGALASSQSPRPGHASDTEQIPNEERAGTILPPASSLPRGQVHASLVGWWAGHFAWLTFPCKKTETVIITNLSLQAPYKDQHQRLTKITSKNPSSSTEGIQIPIS